MVQMLPVAPHLMPQPVCLLLLLSDLRVSSCVLSLVGCFLTAPTWADLDAGPICLVGCTGIVARTAMSAWCVGSTAACMPPFDCITAAGPVALLQKPGTCTPHAPQPCRSVALLLHAPFVVQMYQLHDPKCPYVCLQASSLFVAPLTFLSWRAGAVSSLHLPLSSVEQSFAVCSSPWQRCG